MSLLNDALRAGLDRPHRPDGTVPGHLVVAGAAGPLGAAVLEQSLALTHWPRVSALVTQPLEVALRGLAAVQVDPAHLDDAPALRPAPDTAIVVFDREGSRHGREAAFLRPRPGELPAFAGWLQRQGVRRLLLVMPHAPSLLPQALKAGLANLDEQAVAALGFEQFVIVRPTRSGPDGRDRAAAGANSRMTRWLSSLANGVLSQLQWMVPQREQPLRAGKVAHFVMALARAMPEAGAGTRVAPPELVWDWAQPAGGDRLLQCWLREGRWDPPMVAPGRW